MEIASYSPVHNVASASALHHDFVGWQQISLLDVADPRHLRYPMARLPPTKAHFTRIIRH